jgi:hypothetical protein
MPLLAMLIKLDACRLDPGIEIEKSCKYSSAIHSSSVCETSSTIWRGKVSLSRIIQFKIDRHYAVLNPTANL